MGGKGLYNKKEEEEKTVGEWLYIEKGTKKSRSKRVNNARGGGKEEKRVNKVMGRMRKMKKE